MTLQLAGNRLQGRALEHFAFSQPGFGQALAQIFFINGFVTGQVDARDAWSLGNDNHQVITVTAQLHILEIAGGKQALHRIDYLITVNRVTGLNRQGGIDPFHWQTLEPFYANIVDLER